MRTRSCVKEITPGMSEELCQRRPGQCPGWIRTSPVKARESRSKWPARRALTLLTGGSWVLNNHDTILPIGEVLVTASKGPHPKEAALRARGALHPHPEAVRDEPFLTHEFFDPRDLVQVKYEMLRRHRLEGWAITQAADIFGTSRQTFYVAQGDFESQGLWGLVPRKRGPKGPTKMTEQVLEFVEVLRRDQPDLSRSAVVELILATFGISVHPRTLDRALTRREKKPRRSPGEPS